MNDNRTQGAATDTRRHEHGPLARRLSLIILVMSLVPLALVFLFCRHETVQHIRAQQDGNLSARAWALGETMNKDIASRLTSLRLLALVRRDSHRSLNDLFQSSGGREEGFAGLAILDPKANLVETAGAYPFDQHSFATTWLREAQLRGQAVGLPQSKAPQTKMPQKNVAENVIFLAVTLDHGVERGNVLAAAISVQSLSASTGAQQLEQCLVMDDRVIAVAGSSFVQRLDLLGMGMSGTSQLTDQQNRPWKFAFSRSARFPMAAVTAVPVKALSQDLGSRLVSLYAVALVSTVLVTLAGIWLAHSLAVRLRESEQNREQAFREMEHTQKLSSIGRLATGVAHEINNPLAIINEKAGLMKDLIVAAGEFPKAERFNQLAESILQSVARCRAITHRLLGFARRMEVQTVELDLGEVIREVLGFLEREALYRQVKIELDLDENLPSIETDRGQMQQVFLNLLNNALAAVEDGGRISVTTYLMDPGHVAATVTDNGHGMSRETMAHIFEPFFSTKGDKGSGLGLSITYGIVTRLGGDIRIETEPGKGTSFTVVLPREASLSAKGA